MAGLPATGQTGTTTPLPPIGSGNTLNGLTQYQPQSRAEATAGLDYAFQGGHIDDAQRQQMLGQFDTMQWQQPALPAFTGKDFAQNILRQSTGLADTPWATDSAQFLAADVNKDGKLDISDSVSHLRYQAGLEDPSQTYNYNQLATAIKPKKAGRGETAEEYAAREDVKLYNQRINAAPAQTGEQVYNEWLKNNPQPVEQPTDWTGDRQVQFEEGLSNWLDFYKPENQPQRVEQPAETTGKVQGMLDFISREKGDLGGGAGGLIPPQDGGANLENQAQKQAEFEEATKAQAGYGSIPEGVLGVADASTNPEVKKDFKGFGNDVRKLPVIEPSLGGRPPPTQPDSGMTWVAGPGGGVQVPTEELERQKAQAAEDEARRKEHNDVMNSMTDQEKGQMFQQQAYTGTTYSPDSLGGANNPVLSLEQGGVPQQLREGGVQPRMIGDLANQRINAAPADGYTEPRTVYDPTQTQTQSDMPPVGQPNINTLAAQGITAAGAAAAQGLDFTPSDVSADNIYSSTVNPNAVYAGMVNPGTVTSGAYTPGTVTASTVNPNNINASAVAAERVNPNNINASTVNPDTIANLGLSDRVTANQLANTSLDPYMNPYTQAVIQANETDILRGADVRSDALAAQAQAAGAFGGSRHGIAMGEMDRNTLDQLARSSAGLRQANYGQAQQAALSDIGTNLQGQFANQAASQYDIGKNLEASLANQATGLQGQLANQSNLYNTQLANQQAGLQGQLANQRTGLEAGLANQANLYNTQLANQQAGLQGQLANQRTGLEAGLANQRTGLTAGLANVATDLQANLANQATGLQGQLANQATDLQAGMSNQQAGLQGQLANQNNLYNTQLANQSANLQAALANQGAGMQGQNMRLDAANQLANISNLGFGMGQTVNNNLQQQGMMQQALQQALFDAAQQKYGEFTGHPAGGLDYLTSALLGTPGANTVGTETTTGQKGLFDYLTLISQWPQ